MVRLRNLYSILTEMIDYGEVTRQEWGFGFLGLITCGKGTRSYVGGLMEGGRCFNKVCLRQTPQG